MVGILYESDEWSDWKLHEELERALGEKVAMIWMEDPDAVARASALECLISRVFASAAFRGHGRSLAAMDELTRNVTVAHIPMINERRAHLFEVSKEAAAAALSDAGITVPRVQASGRPAELQKEAATCVYPLIVKPDCGGRTTYTARADDPHELLAFLDTVPDIVFLVEDFIEAKGGFMTRLELTAGRVVLAVRRSIAPNGLSSYHQGSSYAPYPDCPSDVLGAARQAAAALGITYGSFDIIEASNGKNYFIDANSVSNVSEDCTDLFRGLDLMKVYAENLARDIRTLRRSEARQAADIDGIQHAT